MSEAKLNPRVALVLMSGGQDSTTCLHWARQRYDEVHAIVFDYGQAHRVEIECAELICATHGVPCRVVPAPIGNLAPHTALTGGGRESKIAAGLPSTFVPARNIILMAMATAHAVTLGAKILVAGVCQADGAGYPDCRDATIKALNHAINLGLGYDGGLGIEIATPLMDASKAATFEMALNLGVLDEILEATHTCYAGCRTIRHAWGYGCGSCSSCEARRKGWVSFAGKHRMVGCATRSTASMVVI